MLFTKLLSYDVLHWFVFSGGSRISYLKVLYSLGYFETDLFLKTEHILKYSFYHDIKDHNANIIMFRTQFLLIVFIV